MENKILQRMPQGIHQQGKHRVKYIYFGGTDLDLT